jgi:hypothetical protein
MLLILNFHNETEEKLPRIPKNGICKRFLDFSRKKLILISTKNYNLSYEKHLYYHIP